MREQRPQVQRTDDRAACGQQTREIVALSTMNERGVDSDLATRTLA